MAVTSVPAIAPLSLSWTHKRVVSQIRILTNELDNERVQDISIRHHINTALSNIVELLNLSNDPFYGESWNCALDNDPSVRNGFPSTISLSAYIGRLWKINELFLQYYGNCAQVSLQKMHGIVTDLNTQWDKSVAWCQQGNQILVHVGKLIVDTNLDFESGGLALPSEYPITNTSEFRLYVFRNPQLDDYTDTGLNRLIDLPDRHMRLLQLIVQKMVLEEVNKNVGIDIESAIVQLQREINNAPQTEAQFKGFDHRSV